MSNITYIGLGSNLGDSRQILTEAVQKLATLGRCRLKTVPEPTNGTARST